ncbi:MAG: maleylpyruvate isomerase family mycothiol-dependent enzyme [Actinomycetales bacterium]|nr:maleylpyruvate isomerase family mycothiol-dependent enzyme [Actinomycetales bacterium]
MPDALAADLAALEGSTARLGDTLAALSDDQARRPSLLPGWSVGHVLTHLARNADGMVRLVDWALTGDPVPMYPSVEARNADIEAGAGRDAAELAADVRRTAERLQEALLALGSAPSGALDRLVLFGAPRPGAEPDSPARTLPYRRRQEVEIHHLDLGLGHDPAHWPEDFVERTLMFVHARSGAVDVVGEPAEVLAWRLGRGAGPSVRRLDGSAPGEPPPW